jgi:alanyl-tRNA synthetase
VEEEVAELLQQSRNLEKELEAVRFRALGNSLDRIIGAADEVDGIRVAVGSIPSVGAGVLRELGEQLRQRLGASGIGVLGSADEEQGKVYLVASVSDDVISGRGLRAGDLVGMLARELGGGGGGRPTLATAGGKKPEALEETLEKTVDVVRELLS